MHEINKSNCWEDIVWKDMMKIRQLRQEESSSGYGSRESLAEGLLITNKQNDVAVEQPNITCSCKRSGNLRKISSNKGSLSPQSPILTHETDSSLKNLYRHSHSSLPASLENETLAQINENLILQNQQLSEQNHALLEELQISRRFFQGTLTDLSVQLSGGESKIKILQETVSTYEEALVQNKINIEAVEQNKEDTLRNHLLEEQPSDEIHNNEEQCLPNEQNTNEQTTQVVGVRKYRKTSQPSEEKKRSTKPSAFTKPLIKSDSNLKSRMSSLQGKIFSRMKEQLLEKNQSLKTDIELLKVKVNVKTAEPSSGTVVTLQTEEVKQATTGEDNGEGKENGTIKKKKVLPSDESPKRHHSKDRKRLERKTKSENNGTEVGGIKTNQPSFVSQLQREGTLTLEEHKDKLTEEYVLTSTSEVTPDQSPKKEAEKVGKPSRRNSKLVENNTQISTSQKKKTTENTT